MGRKRAAAASVSKTSKRSKSSAEFPCGICTEECHLDTIQCGTCKKWFHRKCENLSELEFEALGTMDTDYNCHNCVSGNDGYFDFLAALMRLSLAAKCGSVALGEAIMREGISLPKDCRFRTDRPANKAHYTLDQTALGLLNAGGLSKLAENSIPCYVNGNGNCLFNSASVWLCGNESLAAELRVRCVVEMLENEKYYNEIPMSDTYRLLSPNYDQAIYDCAINGRYSSVWTVMALASVLRRKVRLVYPPINGTADLAHTALHDVFDPFGHKIEQDEVVIMWTVFGNKHLHSGIWTPDHFVPLLPKNRSKLNAKLYVPDNIPTQITKMKEFSTETCVINDSWVSDNDGYRETCSISSYDEEFPPLSSEIISPNKNVDSSKVDDSNNDVQEECDASINSDMENKGSDSETEPPLPKAVGGQSISKFLDLEEVIQTLLSSDKGSILHAVPDNDKSNLYFLVDNSDNIRRRETKTKSVFFFMTVEHGILAKQRQKGCM